jgi:hypothetical protein
MFTFGCGRSARWSRSVFFQIADDIGDGLDLGQLLVGDLDVEFLFEVHDHSRYPANRFQIVDQSAFHRDGASVDIQLLGDNISNFSNASSKLLFDAFRRISFG